MKSRQLPLCRPVWYRIGSASAVAILILMSGCGQKGPLYRSEPVPDYVWSPTKDNDKEKHSPFSRPAPQTQKQDPASAGTDRQPVKDAAQPNDTAADSNGTTPQSPPQPPGN